MFKRTQWPKAMSVATFFKRHSSTTSSSNFAVVSNTIEYDDKSRFIPTLEKLDNKLVMYRPNNFGKTLIISMLRFYYDSFYENIFDEIFGESWIGQKNSNTKSYMWKTPLANSYIVLSIDLATIDKSELSIKASVEHILQMAIQDLCARYPNALAPNTISLIEKRKFELLLEKYNSKVCITEVICLTLYELLIFL